MEGQPNNLNTGAPVSSPAPSPVPAPAPAPVPMPQPTPVAGNMPQKEDSSSMGMVVALIVILALVVLGGLYFWGQRASTTETPAPVVEDQATASIKAQGTGDDTSSLEDDLNSTDIDTLDAEINAS